MYIVELIFGFFLLFLIILILIVRGITLDLCYEVKKYNEEGGRGTRWLIIVTEKKAGIFRNRVISYEKWFYHPSNKSTFVRNLKKQQACTTKT